jgi:hypothetical protein
MNVSSIHSKDTSAKADLNKFAHRLPVMEAAEDALKRALALVDLLEVCTEVANMDSFQPETLWRSAQAIRFELLDVQELMAVQS